MLYIKYKIHYNNIEGMNEKSLKANIYEIATDKNSSVTNINKLTAIHNLLLVSDDQIPTKESIKQKNDLNSLSKLSPSERSDKITSLRDNMDKIYPILEKVFPQLDKPFWLNVLTNAIPGSPGVSTPVLTNAIPGAPGVSNPSGTIPEIPYTFNEQIYIILNKDDIQDSEKIKQITKLTYTEEPPAPVALAKPQDPVAVIQSLAPLQPSVQKDNKITKAISTIRKGINKTFARKKKKNKKNKKK
jgi:hypothetical protein